MSREDAIANFLELSHKLNKKKFATIQELVDGISVLIKSVMRDLGFCSKSSELPSNVWSAVETTALELTGLSEWTISTRNQRHRFNELNLKP